MHGKWPRVGSLHGSKSTQESPVCLFVCLFVRQVNKQRKKQHLRPNTAIAYTQLTLLRSKWGRSACIRCFHTQSRTHHSMPFLITRQVHSSIWIQTLRTPRVNWWMYVHQTYLLYEALLNFSFTKFINIKFLHNPQVCSRSCLCDAQISLKVITWAPQWKVGENQGVLHSQCPTSLLSRIFSIFHLKEMPVIPQRHYPPSIWSPFPPSIVIISVRKPNLSEWACRGHQRRQRLERELWSRNVQRKRQLQERWTSSVAEKM